VSFTTIKRSFMANLSKKCRA